VYFLHVTQHKDAPEKEQTEDVLGVDLGICYIATDSEGEQFRGAAVRDKRTRYVARRGALQRVGTCSAKRRLKQISGRERRYMKVVNHCISKTLVTKAATSRKALALENLTGIRESATVRREQQHERHSWAFFQLRRFLTYRAASAGVSVVLVDPAYTSQTCSRCGHCERANRQSQSSFVCRRCGFAAHADCNAALMIAQVARQAAYSRGGMSPATSPSAFR
jgi:IS605 OrfB family transposase